ncbi:Spermatid-specific manchette-related protein 1 [Egretta garzetta]|uniref:Spermatid-specific manchette-related protein 1 n=1 Tax=Egretta garzetta TaxID=188379 RepID=A0A091KGY3_EGRGA|nr:Spermatid-specific manchette-related protein 1 [Egretta garzetta]
MFLFSKKHKTPISTYTDSYRPPCSVKKTVHEQVPQQLWKENKFVTQGLTMPPVQNPSSQGQPEQLINVATQEYYRSSIDRVSYWPEKYCLARPEEKYSPVFVNDVNYITWRTGPYNSVAWNKHSSYLPPLPKDARMDTILHRIPVTYPVKPTCLNQFERELVADRLPVYTVARRGPFQLYYSPCSGRHYCLREMDYYVDGARAIRSHLHTLGERAEYPMLQLQPWSNVLYIYTPTPAILPVQEP